MADATSTKTPPSKAVPFQQETEPVPTTHTVRVVTAASLFDGHDAAINVMRRILQTSGAEVIHLGHNRAVHEVVDAAIQEDAQAIAISSYQGGHVEYFSYARELLNERGASHIRVYGGGGGVIVHDEIELLHSRGVNRIFSPDDGRRLGLQGMINIIMRESDFSTLEVAGTPADSEIGTALEQHGALARSITALESERGKVAIEPHGPGGKRVPVVGITGSGGAGKSSLTDELILRFIHDFPDKHVALLAVDPSITATGGATLGDRIRVNTASHPRVFMRSLATRESETELPAAVYHAVNKLKQAGFDLVIVETPGVGQWNKQIVEVADVSLYVMTQEFGAQLQLEKHNMLYLADLIVLNKFERQGSKDALRAIQKQVQRNKKAFNEPLEKMPVYATIASRFADPGVNGLYKSLLERMGEATGEPLQSTFLEGAELEIGDNITRIIPPQRLRYLNDIAETVRRYKEEAVQQADVASRAAALERALTEAQQAAGDDARRARVFNGTAAEADTAQQALGKLVEEAQNQMHPRARQALADWETTRKQYEQDEFVYTVRDKEFRQPLVVESLSHSKVPRIALPEYTDRGDLLKWLMLENLPGTFPFTAGVFPLKRQNEDPTRMFAGEGGPEKTNKRFHYLCEGQPAARLSTAFDSVTLYGEDPDRRPDIWGKIGNAGVAISSLDDAKRLYSGFDLCAPNTSVSMTINGPAPMLLAFFLNTAVDQQVERWCRDNGKLEEVEAYRQRVYQEAGVPAPTYRGELPRTHDGTGLALLGISGKELAEAGIIPQAVYDELRTKALNVVRGTVQADILKEDQAQNTCIFSTEFALRMMGDVQAFFTTNDVRNFYSVSISGYHIAEAGANPITQLALTLANGFTYVEYYLSRGLAVDGFAPNLSFFFSNGLDPEYTVIGRVARRIWAVAMRERYGANDRSQKLKYHIQTSGRSLHAQEIAFNDIRTTLQAWTAIADNCNSLHTNAYDEAITTPTEESVRRALAIQLIINREYGLAKNENPLQGAFIVELLTDIVEEAVLDLFVQISERGGVLGAMETAYQRMRIQEESLYYEYLKNSGQLPIIGVNTFLNPQDQADGALTKEVELRRSSENEKEDQLAAAQAFQKRHAAKAEEALTQLKQAAIQGRNIFEQMMQAAQTATLGQISAALYEVGGQYRRNL